MADNRYCIEYAKTGRSGCKKCKTPIEKGVPRIGKITPNPFSDDGGDMKVWYHTRCMFETLKVSLNTSIITRFPSLYIHDLCTGIKGHYPLVCTEGRRVYNTHLVVYLHEVEKNKALFAKP